MKDGEIREIVNQLRDIAIKYHDHQSLRERLAQVVVPTLKDKLAFNNEHIKFLEDQLKSCKTDTVCHFGAYLVDNHEDKFEYGENQIMEICNVVLLDLKDKRLRFFLKYW